ncbi:DUF6512 family protein [Clostridium cadaveris]|uniref:Uncharacterized protein n=1 Tax=Clostridium cadaveris TaxID=1529 RepID=A0A1I2KBI7_9CLOT|nr:DUF6512 family protein [Clostridium cadaveris]MDM8310900.1 DUF6512 family protein [Clostridium cadaveris]MDY4949193.1 DUF6512 family protein [Clostridium cadaveris]NME63393.1 hypothetical protein [Clostridium cadaveris]NWK11518.1 hypothetical protein [Clostridium cadaveris]UFH65682.1 hypothetical protein KQH81_03855 [Clostridium cadaveris]
MNWNNFNNPEKWIIVGIPALFFIGSLMHFIYDLTGKSYFIGAFSPINESVWEHSKMIVIPMIDWWSLYYLFCGSTYNIDRDKWFMSLIISLISSIIIMIAFFYTYSSALGCELLWVDILDLFLSLAVGQLLGLHYYNYGTAVNINISLIILVSIVLLFIIFTFYPPHIPMFKDSITGKYGI